MALRAALKDRARILRQEADAKRVEGRTVYHTRTSALFKCRLDISEGAEHNDRAGEASVEENPTLLCDRVDADHEPLRIQLNDELELESRDVSPATTRGWNLVGIFQVDAEPKPLRKKRKVIGYELRLKRISESKASPGRTS